MAIYLKMFENHTLYETYTASTEFITPNVSLCEQENEVHYTPPHDYSQDYFTMVVTVGGNIKWSGSTTANTLSYSKDNGSTWTTANSADTISVAAGDKILWKGTPTPQSNKGIGKFSGDTDARYSVEGNAMSLLFGDDFKGQTSLEGKNYALRGLFADNTNVTSAENLSLPATTLASRCYQYMFEGCTSLTTAPELLATTLASNCYSNMFYECTSLTTAPELPATTLAIGCYGSMFQGCTSLTTAPELPATTLEDGCYSSMFNGCTSLTTASVLSATTLAESCYSDMFRGCTRLTTAPELPATTLADYCYTNMFNGCTSLTTAPELLATTLANYCYAYMFYGCTSLNYIKAMFTTTPSSSYTDNWVNGVASSGTFVKNAAATWDVTGVDGIPSGWTVQVPVQGDVQIFADEECTVYPTKGETYTDLYARVNIPWGYGGEWNNDGLYCFAPSSEVPNDPYAMSYLIDLNSADSSQPYTSGQVVNLHDGFGGTEIPADAIFEIYKPYTPHDYSRDYLTFVALESGTFKFTNAANYSLDGGETWTALAANTNTPTVIAGQRILWKANITPQAYVGVGTFSNGTCDFDVEGNAMSLIYGDNFVGQTTFPNDEGYCGFYLLFNSNTHIVNGKNLCLPATTLTNYCYGGMFNDCTSLTTAPELPATTLAAYCYGGMFNGCTSLTTAPELPATTLALGCYDNMFGGCTNLTTVPELLATTLASSCYSHMFQNCTSLTTAPELPATTLASSCYQYMFSGCTSLTTAPELPATTLETNCYEGMFKGCTNLTTAPELPATTLTNYCYDRMFGGCTSLTTAPELPTTTLANGCYQYMFSGCTALTSITCLATNISARNCTNNWVSGVASSGTFTKAVSMNSWTRGVSGIPSNWTVEDASN